MPMRDVVICLKDAPHESDAEILSFRRELDERGDLRIFHYATVGDLKSATHRGLRWVGAELDPVKDCVGNRI